MIRLVDASTTRPLRRAVLRPNWPTDAPLSGDDAADAVHLAGFADDGDVVAACLLLPRPYPRRQDAEGTWQLRGMATAESVRGTGVGTRLLEAAVAEVRERGGRLVWCEARSSALGFYLRNDFVIDGAEYPHAETGAPHHYMHRAT